MKDPRRHPCHCHCECHQHDCRIHVTVTCDCGRPVRPPPRDRCCPPPRDGCQPPRDGCPPPPIPDQPGVVNLPQDDPPPPPRTAPWPVWQDPGRPPRGTPGEIDWFRARLGEIQRKGPTFGPRKDEYLPYLVVRASSSDRGNRPISGVFWESPDIFVAPNLDAATAPLQPPTTGGLAVANAPNTLYAHVWNLGNSPAYRVRVEFYWFNPSLGIDRASASLVGAAYVDLGNRFTHYPEWRQVDSSFGSYLSRGAHAIVRCPVTWVPQFVNGGHECLVVRAFEVMTDPLSPDQFSSAADRHVAQRNIAVALSQSPAQIDLPLDLGHPKAPGKATVEIEVAPPSSMEFLKLYAGPGGPTYTAATEPLAAGLLPPALRGTRTASLAGIPFEHRKVLLRPSETFDRGCDPAQVGFHASVPGLKKNEAYVVRIRQRIDARVVGGYSVVLLGR